MARLSSLSDLYNAAVAVRLTNKLVDAAHLLEVSAAHGHAEADGGGAVRVRAAPRQPRPPRLQPLVSGCPFGRPGQVILFVQVL